MTKPGSVPITTRPDIAEQVASGADLTDLQLPVAPTAEVRQWEEMSPLAIEDHESLSEYVFRWLHPPSRERGSMVGWKYVAGDMARAVRRCGIIPALVGGDDSDEMIRNGDLILGWMMRSMADQRKIFYQKQNATIKSAVTEQEQVAQELKRGPGAKHLDSYGEVKQYVGPLVEE